MREGITALMLNRNEPTFKVSLESIIDFVDEIILVDGSTKEEYYRVYDTCLKFDKVKFYHMKPDYGKQINFALSKADTRWILRWDSDFTAKPNIDFLFHLTKVLKEGQNYAIEFGVEDSKGKPHYECYIFTNNDILLKPRIRKYWRRLIHILKRKYPPRIGWVPFPFEYFYIRLTECYACHHHYEKPEWRRIEGKYQPIWSLMSEKERGNLSFDEFVEMQESKLNMSR